MAPFCVCLSIIYSCDLKNTILLYTLDVLSNTLMIYNRIVNKEVFGKQFLSSTRLVNDC